MPDYDLTQLVAEVTRLENETRDLTRNYPLDAVADMRSGNPREGASANERMARERFARINEIRSVLRANERLALK